MKHLWFIGLLLALAAGFALRLPQLERRPLHTDEAVHAIKLGDFIEHGRYTYDPQDYHGPTMYYATIPLAKLRGERTTQELTVTTMRLVPVFFGIALIGLLLAAPDALGKAGAAWAALLTAVSPMMVYYSRYYIMEILLVVFTFGLLLAGWRYWRTGKPGWLILAGACGGLMHGTKETCILTWFSIGVAGIALWWTEPKSSRPALRPLHLLAGIGAAVVVSVACFSVFFTDWRGVPESVLTYVKYSRRGQGSGHEHPWWWYFELFAWHRTGKLLWTEIAIVALAIVGAARAFRERLAFGKFLAVYVVVMAAVYAAIPYKTPWSVLTLAHGAILLAGIGAAWLARRIPWLAWPVLLAVSAHLVSQSVRGSCRLDCDERNPWVYSHTCRDAERLSQRLHDIAAVSPDGRAMVVKFMSKEYWPMPWYLRDFSNVGYWNRLADTNGASVVISSPEFNLNLGDGWQTELFGLRPGVLLQVNIRRDLWEKFLETRK